MKDETLPGRTDLLPVEIADLLYRYSRSMCFTYKEIMNRGAAMSSPVSPIGADL